MSRLLRAKRSRWMVICVLLIGGATTVAVVLGIGLYIRPRLYWRHLWILLLPVASSMVLWLVLSAPRSARFAALGFVMGVVIEFVALSYLVTNELIPLTPGKWTPEGWYPLALPAERLLINRGWAMFPRAALPGMFIGMVLSGVAGCIMMLIVRSLGRAMGKWIRS